ncbi:MAG: hemolysin III family protein [Nitrospirae bacterium]|nr:hemolysin III family protein [Nitrospirota bacterium]MBI3352541.1 hemolysin III family protein [Nitrospirota bacterium]
MYKGERFNGLTHLLGAVFAGIGMVFLIVIAARQNDPWKIVSFTVYGTILLILYTFSTLYHSFHGKAKTVFQKLEHLTIYLLIAGTYTPITLVTLRGPWGWSLFGVIWVLAIFGMLQETFLKKEARILSVVIYIMMGWTGLIAIQPLAQALPFAGVAWLVIGGLFYTIGVIFFALEERLAHSHGIWHLFVLAGSASHYFAILFYVA